MSPCQAVNGYFLPARYIHIYIYICIYILYLVYILATFSGMLRSSDIETEHRHSSKAWRGLMEHVCRISESISETQRGHWDVCAVKVQNNTR